MTQLINDWSGDSGVCETVVLWTGKSGRRYTMSKISVQGMALATGRVYALVEAGVIRWIGTTTDLIADQFSRDRFRQVSGNGAQMFSLPAPDDELACMTLAWDLEGTAHYDTRDAA